MAGRGPAPKAGAVRSRPTLHTLPAEGYQGEYPPLEGRHEPETEAWYETWAHSPQAAAFIATDWQRLQQIAFLVDELYNPTKVYTQSGEKNAMTPVAVLAELRQQEKMFGATVLDRASLYMDIKVSDDATAEGSAPVPQSQRRSRLRAVSE